LRAHAFSGFFHHNHKANQMFKHGIFAARARAPVRRKA
jgi:hypothetical protein